MELYKIMKNIKKYNKLYNKIKLEDIRKKYNLNNIIVLDIETTGLLNSDYIIQIAYNIYNQDMVCIKQVNYLINENVNKTDFFKIFSLAEIKSKGLDVKQVLTKLNQDFLRCKYVIGHNISFDMEKIMNYYNKHKVEHGAYPLQICTMKISKNILNMRNIKGYIKYPKLSELYNYYYNLTADGTLHDASYDIELTYLCFIKLVQNNCVTCCNYVDNKYVWQI